MCIKPLVTETLKTLLPYAATDLCYLCEKGFSSMVVLKPSTHIAYKSYNH